MSECETVSVSEWAAGAAGRAADGGAGRRTAGGGRGAVKVRTPHKDVGNKINT